MEDFWTFDFSAVGREQLFGNEWSKEALCLWCVGGAVVMTLSKSYNGREEVGRTPLDQQAEGGHFPRQCYVEFIRSHLLVALISMMVAITKLTIEN